MNAETKQSNLSFHEEAFLLLPWYLNQTVSESERKIISAHLAECDTCRQELEFLTQAEGVSSSSDDISAIPQNGFARLLERIDEDVPTYGVATRQSVDLKNRMVEWLGLEQFGVRGFSVAVSAILVLAVTTMVLWPTQSPHDPVYQTLTSGNSAEQQALQIRIVLSQGADIDLLQSRVKEIWSSIVIIEMPGTGTYSIILPVESDPATVAQLLGYLKDSDSIKLVQLQAK